MGMTKGSIYMCLDNKYEFFSYSLINLRVQTPMVDVQASRLMGADTLED